MTDEEEVFVRSQEPWYADKQYKINDPMAVEWGYLQFLSNGDFTFYAGERPSDEEIKASNAYRALTGQIYS
ncbi:MAG: hypothetical protein JKY40_10560 [Gammaproteobacteria bacterium]|nr:hypothetical protein [Gammaproteobacteria bacterium]MBL4729727.1 hypothetical protein [Gammaproteobacteria bacterium]